MRIWPPVVITLFTIALAGCTAKRGASPAMPPSSARPATEHYGGLATTDHPPSPRTPPSEPDFADEAAPSSSREARAHRHRAPEPPGLGTEYGEWRPSDSYSTRFRRAHGHPDTTLAVWYDDFSGVRAVAGRGPWQNSTVSTSDGALSLTLVDERGRALEALDAGPQRYAVGEPGQRYQLEITNHTGIRYEVVASVDGLDVIDGGRASTTKRGYVLGPFDQVVIDGWRTSDEAVAAFRFGRVSDSYAERRGDGRNIGVIGVAFFHERGAHRHDDRRRRREAEPFSDRFAPPPPPRW